MELPTPLKYKKSNRFQEKEEYIIFLYICDKDTY